MEDVTASLGKATLISAYGKNEVMELYRVSKHPNSEDKSYENWFSSKILQVPCWEGDFFLFLLWFCKNTEKKAVPIQLGYFISNIHTDEVNELFFTLVVQAFSFSQALRMVTY